MCIKIQKKNSLEPNVLFFLTLFLGFPPAITEMGRADHWSPNERGPKHQSEYNITTSSLFEGTRDNSPQQQKKLIKKHSAGLDHKDAWYYLFSTIPQTFAAVHALLFGLAFFRLQQIRQTLETLEQEIDAFFNRVGLKEEYYSCCAAEVSNRMWDLYLEKLEMLKSQENVSNIVKADHDYLRSENFILGRVEKMKSNLSIIKIFWKQFQKSFFFTGVLIVATTILIPLGGFVNNKFFLFSWAILSIIVVFATVLYIRLVKILLPLHRARVKHGGTIANMF